LESRQSAYGQTTSFTRQFPTLASYQEADICQIAAFRPVSIHL
jgi:hypothetical protein